MLSKKCIGALNRHWHEKFPLKVLFEIENWKNDPVLLR